MTNFITSTSSPVPDEDALIRQRMQEELAPKAPVAPVIAAKTKKIKASKASASPVSAPKEKNLAGCWESPVTPGRVSLTLSGHRREDH